MMSILQSIGAVLGGFIATALLVMVGTGIAMALLLPPKTEGPMQPTVPYLAANLILSFLAAVAGGYLCGWLAPSHPTIHFIALATLFGLMAFGMALAVGPEPGQPAWYPWVIGVIGISGVLAGGVLRVALS